MAYCTNCGIEIEEGKLLCEKCEKTLSEEAQATAVVIKKEMIPADKKDMTMAGIVMLPCLLFVNCLFFGGVGAGIALSALLILGATLWYIKKKQARFSPYTYFCSAFFALHSLSLCFSDDRVTKNLTVFILLALYCVILTDAFNLRRFKKGSYAATIDVLSTAILRSFPKIGDGCFALFRKADKEGNIHRRKIGKVMIGILISLPVLLIIVPLLIKSDAAFEGLLNKFSFANVGEIFVTILFGAFGFLLLFSLLFSLAPKEEDGKETINKRGIDSTIICSFLAVISAVYVVYIGSQFVYFTSGFLGILPKEFTLAQYARRGFFEMCAICAINLVIIFLSCVFCGKKEDKKLPLGIKIACIFISIFSILIIGTAISKMLLYISELGMTRRRIITSMFMIFLAATFIIVIIRLFTKKIGYMKYILLAGCAVLLVTCCADVDRVIATYNVNAYLSGSLKTVDIDTIDKLESDAVIEPLIKLYNEANSFSVRREAKTVLNKRMQTFMEFSVDQDGNTICNKVDYDIRSFNLFSHRAKVKLAQDWKKYYKNYDEWDFYYN